VQICNGNQATELLEKSVMFFIGKLCMCKMRASLLLLKHVKDLMEI